MKARKLIGRQVEYPTPWRVAEQVGNQHVVVCADGHECAAVSDIDLAELIVRAINSLSDAEEVR